MPLSLFVTLQVSGIFLLLQTGLDGLLDIESSSMWRSGAYPRARPRPMPPSALTPPRPQPRNDLESSDTCLRTSPILLSIIRVFVELPGGRSRGLHPGSSAKKCPRRGPGLGLGPPASEQFGNLGYVSEDLSEHVGHDPNPCRAPRRPAEAAGRSPSAIKKCPRLIRAHFSHFFLPFLTDPA